MNPEVLIVHKPLVSFDKTHSRRVLRLLREFVDMRGIAKPPEGRRLRRPRTCIFSTSADQGTEQSDAVFQINERTVTLTDVAELQMIRDKCIVHFNLLDKDADQGITLPEWLQRLPEAPWIMQLLGISEETAKGPRKVLDDALTKIFDIMDTTC